MKRSQLVAKLETEYCFRDYRILPKRYFRKIHREGIHRMLDQGDGFSVDYDVTDAINVFCRDGYGTIYFYI